MPIYKLHDKLSQNGQISLLLFLLLNFVDKTNEW